jgi:hypothetical protein
MIAQVLDSDWRFRLLLAALVVVIIVMRVTAHVDSHEPGQESQWQKDRGNRGEHIFQLVEAVNRGSTLQRPAAAPGIEAENED